MNFSKAISTCLGKYGTFVGRAGRSEFWWFYLFTLLMTWGSAIVGAAAGGGMIDLLPSLVSLAFFIPTLAAGSRRLHDIGKSGWWQLLLFIPILGWILLVIWFATNTKTEGDRFNLNETA